MHEGYFETAYCRTKIPTILRGIFGIFHDISICLFIYLSTIYRRTPNDLLRNPGWETLIQTDSTNRRKIRLGKVNMELQLDATITVFTFISWLMHKYTNLDVKIYVV
jgi:hypothetical protein